MAKMSEITFYVYRSRSYLGAFVGRNELEALNKAARNCGYEGLEDHIQSTEYDRDDFVTRRPSDRLTRE